MSDKVKCTAMIKINGDSQQKGDKIKISYQTDDGRFRFSKTMLAGISFKLQVM
jgi:hypothetical protein